MEGTLRGLNTIDVTTSSYHSQSNAKVERFHPTLSDVLAKLTGYNKDSWDKYLTQVLAVVRFSMNKTMKFGLVGRVFPNGPGDWGSIKDLKNGT